LLRRAIGTSAVRNVTRVRASLTITCSTVVISAPTAGIRQEEKRESQLLGSDCFRGWLTVSTHAQVFRGITKKPAWLGIARSGFPPNSPSFRLAICWRKPASRTATDDAPGRAA